MGAWYTIGLFVGIGVGAGIFAAGLVGAARWGAVLAMLIGGAVGALLGLGLAGVEEAVGGAVGGILGGFGASQLVSGALARGGTRLGMIVLLGAAGMAAAVLAVIPIVGYLEAVVVPVLGARLRRRAGDRYAGLRILARD